MLTILSNLRRPILVATAAALMSFGTIAAAKDRPTQPSPHGYTLEAGSFKAPERPTGFDHGMYHHDYKGGNAFGVGPFFGEPDWTYDELALDTVLPEFYRTPERYIVDYQLFGLEVPPVGCEWVRYGPDALLVNIKDGLILQTVQDLFT